MNPQYIDIYKTQEAVDARKNMRLKDAAEERQADSDAEIEILSYLVVLGLVVTMILLAFWPRGTP